MYQSIRGWDEAALSYSKYETSSPYSLFCREYIASNFENVSNKKILDAGCGNGEYTHILTKNGCTVIGCDASNEMLKIAKEKYPKYRYDNVNFMDKTPYDNNYFDIVLCHLVLMNIDPIDNAIAEFCRITKENGIFFFSIVHPAFYLAEWERNEDGIALSKKMSNYITPTSMQQMFWGSTMHYHRPVSYYFNKIIKAGFTLKEMHEPQVYDCNESKIPDIPLYLFAEFQKL